AVLRSRTRFATSIRSSSVAIRTSSRVWRAGRRRITARAHRNRGKRPDGRAPGNPARAPSAASPTPPPRCSRPSRAAARPPPRAAATGCDWQAATDVVDKIDEEVEELRETLRDADRARTEEELGDLLFAVANLARKLKIEPEAALRAANRKFTGRFAAMQQRLE